MSRVNAPDGSLQIVFLPVLTIFVVRVLVLPLDLARQQTAITLKRAFRLDVLADLEISETVEAALVHGLVIHSHRHARSVLRRDDEGIVAVVYAANDAFCLLSIVVVRFLSVTLAIIRMVLSLREDWQLYRRASGRQRDGGSTARDQNCSQYSDRDLALEQESQFT